MTRPAPVIVGTFAALLLLFGAYIGAYYAMVWPMRITMNGYSPSPAATYHWHNEPIGNPTVNKILYPAHLIDRLLRPNVWK